MTANSEFPIDRVRAETPACESLLHFNNAGASLQPNVVSESIREYLELEQQIGGYEAHALKADEIAHFNDAFASLLGTQAHEIAYVENATRAWDMAFYSLPLREGDRVLTHVSEYASNYLAFMQLEKRLGIDIDIAPSDGSGQIDVDALSRAVTPRTKVIAITHVPSQGGLVNPATEVGKVAREHGLIYLLDACQSVGQLRVDVGEIGCHLLSGTGRKFLRGPRGTGFLYVSDEILGRLDPPFIDLHSAEWTSAHRYEYAPGARRFENWECFVAGKIGLGVAVDYAMKIGLEAIEQRVSALAESLRGQLSEIDGVEVRDLGEKRSGIVTFTTEHEASGDLVTRLRQQRINISSTPKTYAQLDLGGRGIEAVARASVHYFNTDDEIARFCAAVAGSDSE
ncbi:MAG: aminotransferase class V-fold PLP-dependent enzyme [Woeseiaceae bacterium]|nr:aminotransferase class V-fold PLP-dependent enzyme [Woeseiaceae bacterium]